MRWSDFGVYRQAAVRSLHAEPLYRVEDGHYQFKYLPAFALAMTPVALVNRETAKVLWFAASLGLLAAFLRWSVVALPERRWSIRSLLWITLVLMAKFYAHELTLGQTNLLLGALLVAALLGIQIERPVAGGVLIGLAVFVKPYALILLPWLAATQGVLAAAAAGGVIVLGLALPALVYGWAGNLAQLAGWWQTVTTSTAPNLLGADNISLAAMWAKWIGPSSLSTGLAIATSAAALGLVASSGVNAAKSPNPSISSTPCCMLLIPLLSPQGWDYVLLLATPAVVCFSTAGAKPRPRGGGRWPPRSW